jgi:RNA polymerase sigma-70 factor (ECF subfamily)
MKAEDRLETERALEMRRSTGDFDGLATDVLAAYGPEIYSFLHAVHRETTDADEVFSLFAEALWKALPSFEGASTLRTFAYAIARRTSLRYRRDAARRRKRFGQLESAEISNVVAEVRARTATFMRTTTRSRLNALRASLDVEDQELLMLRVDRSLPWDALVVVLRGEDEAPLSVDEQKRQTARLRKRFQLLKDKLRELARREGLLDLEDDG